MGRGGDEGEKEWNDDGWKDDFKSNEGEFDLENPYDENHSTDREGERERDTSFEEDNVNMTEGIRSGYELMSEEERQKKKFPLPSQKIEIELGTGGLMAVIFGRSFLQGAFLGGILGGLQGAVVGFQNRAALGASGVGSSILTNALSSGRLTGLWLGVYQSSNAGLGRIRHKKDVVNPMIAGFLAGSISYLSTRNRAQIIYSGVTSAAMMGLMHTLSGGNFQI